MTPFEFQKDLGLTAQAFANYAQVKIETIYSWKNVTPKKWPIYKERILNNIKKKIENY